MQGNPLRAERARRPAASAIVKSSFVGQSAVRLLGRTARTEHRSCSEEQFLSRMRRSAGGRYVQGGHRGRTPLGSDSEGGS